MVMRVSVNFDARGLAREIEQMYRWHVDLPVLLLESTVIEVGSGMELRDAIGAHMASVLRGRRFQVVGVAPYSFNDFEGQPCGRCSHEGMRTMDGGNMLIGTQDKNGRFVWDELYKDLVEWKMDAITVVGELDGPRLRAR